MSIDCTPFCFYLLTTQQVWRTIRRKEDALEAVRKLLEEGCTIHAIQRGGIAVMDGEAVHSYFKSLQSQ